MSRVLYRGHFSDDHELCCNWLWDTRDNTLEVSVWNYNMDTIGPIHTTKALYDGIGKLVVENMRETPKIKHISYNFASLSLTQIPPLEMQRQIAADVMALLSNKIIRWEERISSRLCDSEYRQSWVCKHNVPSMLDMAAIRLGEARDMAAMRRGGEKKQKYDIPEHLEELVQNWKRKMESCGHLFGVDDSLGFQCLKQKELEEIVDALQNTRGVTKLRVVPS